VTRFRAILGYSAHPAIHSARFGVALPSDTVRLEAGVFDAGRFLRNDENTSWGGPVTIAVTFKQATPVREIPVSR
jgi:hypothetical protein